MIAGEGAGEIEIEWVAIVRKLKPGQPTSRNDVDMARWCGLALQMSGLVDLGPQQAVLQRVPTAAPL